MAYTLSKYGMSLCALGMAAEFRDDGIGVNALWPRTVIHTAALAMIPGVDREHCRKPEIVADAAHAILSRDGRQHTGNTYIDEEVLRAEGVTDFDPYAVVPGTKQFCPICFWIESLDVRLSRALRQLSRVRSGALTGAASTFRGETGSALR